MHGSILLNSWSTKKATKKNTRGSSSLGLTIPSETIPSGAISLLRAGRNSAALGILVFLFITGCGSKESLTPLFPSVEYDYEEGFDAHIVSEIPMTIVKPSLLHRITGALFGWIPVAGDILEFPIDLATALVPSIQDVSHPEIPGSSQINDPETLKQIAEMTIEDGYLDIVPEDDRGPSYHSDRCWFRKCPEVGFTFLKEIRIYIEFSRKSLNKHGSSKIETATVLIGVASVDKDYDRKHQILHFEMTGEDLKPYFAAYPNYVINLVADAHLPEHNVYIAGRFSVHVTFQLSPGTIPKAGDSIPRATL